MKSTIRGIAFGCCHHPFIRPSCWDWIVRVCKENGPFDWVVNLGDLFEAGSASVHGNEWSHNLTDEYAMAAEFLKEVRGAASRSKRSRCSCVWMLGNHDDNIQKKDPKRVPKGLRDAVHWGNSKWASEFNEWLQIPYLNNFAGTFRLGKVVFSHGFATGRTSDENEAVQMAMETGFEKGDLFVRAHTHVPQAPRQVMRNNVPLPWWYANVGTLGPLKPDWASRMYTGRWGAGALLFETPLDHRIPGAKWSATLLEGP